MHLFFFAPRCSFKTNIHLLLCTREELQLQVHPHQMEMLKTCFKWFIFQLFSGFCLINLFIYFKKFNPGMFLRYFQRECQCVCYEGCSSTTDFDALCQVKIRCNIPSCSPAPSHGDVSQSCSPCRQQVFPLASQRRHDGPAGAGKRGGWWRREHTR